MINFFKEDEEMSWVAAHAFTDEHHGSAITEAEFEHRMSLLDEYKDEVVQTRSTIEANPDFSSWTYEQQINYAANSIVELKNQKENKTKLR